MDKTPTKTQNNIVQEIIDKSGNVFHLKVVSHFRKTGWEVLISPYYTDSYTNKPREVDLIVKKDYECKDYKNDLLGYIGVTLVVECKYIVDKSIIVFWFDSIDKERMVKQLLQNTSLDDPKKSSITNKHRYMQVQEIAKLYDYEKNEKETKNDVTYKTTTQCLNALTSNLGPQSFDNNNFKTYLVDLRYPIVVFNSFNDIYQSKKDKPEEIKTNFMLEMNYVHGGQTKYYLVDMVDFHNIKQLITEIEIKDVAAVREKLETDNKLSNESAKKGTRAPSTNRDG